MHGVIASSMRRKSFLVTTNKLQMWCVWFVLVSICLKCNLFKIKLPTYLCNSLGETSPYSHVITQAGDHSPCSRGWCTNNTWADRSVFPLQHETRDIFTHSSYSTAVAAIVFLEFLWALSPPLYLNKCNRTEWGHKLTCYFLCMCLQLFNPCVGLIVPSMT